MKNLIGLILLVLVIGEIESMRHFFHGGRGGGTFGPRAPEHRIDTSTLKLVQLIHRHGARSAVVEFPIDQHKNYFSNRGIGPGQLVPRGKQLALNLGKFLRKRYGNYFSQNYVTDEVFTQSSDVDRVIMTGNYAMYALYNQRPKPIPDLIPAHVLHAKIDNKIMFMKAPCPNFPPLLAAWKASDELKKFDAENQHYYDIVTDNTGYNVTNWFDAANAYDTLLVEQENGLELPAWASDELMQAFRDSSIFLLKMATDTPEMSIFRVGPLLNEICNNIDFKSGKTITDPEYHQRKAAKMYHFSSHADTVSAVMDVLGVYDDEYVDYTEAVLIEWHEGDIIKVFYRNINDVVTEKEMPECPSPCKFETFKEKFDKYLIDRTEWSKKCGL